MTKEMYTPPEAVVVEFGQEDVFCDVIGASGEHTGTGGWEEED